MSLLDLVIVLVMAILYVAVLPHNVALGVWFCIVVGVLVITRILRGERI